MSSPTKKYDVFLSFRGEDTRTNFTGHLYTALAQKSIRTYIDYQLNRGEDVWPELAKAIEASRVSIVVFSENYATSKWCLEELVKILQCRKDHGQVVIPVFYEIDPSHIRKQTGSYEKAFAKHELDLGGKDNKSNKQKVLGWRAALTEAANISGWDSRTHNDDSQIIKNIVNDVSQKRNLRYPNELEGLLGNEVNCTKVESLMKIVRVIGIWGMGGIGKTTIAKVLFAKFFPQYDHVCFVAKEYSLDKLLFELLKKEDTTSNAVEFTFDMSKLSDKKVFIVLDDVDSSNQLEYLWREYRHLSPDSRLIITTRHRQLLTGRVDWIYEVEKWMTPKSLELFSLEAFKESNPQKDYEDLSKRVVDYAGGIPLALKVLGSYLRFKEKEFWEDTLRKLNEYPNKDIQEMLKVSYDGLDDLEKKIFLDIAFFFKGENKDSVIKILDACGLYAINGINVLVDKALITISNNNRIQMHDLLQKMGLEIVRQECTGDPGRRSRLRDSEVRGVLEKAEGTEAIEGITLDLSQIKNLHLRADTFKKMKKLRLLKFYILVGQSSGTMHFPTVLESFSDELRYFEWNRYRLESLPRTFCAKFLVEIRMPHSNVKQLWQGSQELDNLEGIDLSECKQFKELPDLSKAPRLKWVNLSDCESLYYLHPSVLSADTLVTLILDRCTNLKNVKAKKHLKSLETISVNGCLSLKEFAVSSDLIENLDLSNTGIETLDTSIGRLHNLKWLNLEGLRLKQLLKELSCLKSLEELKLCHSGLVIDKLQLHVLFDGLRSLKLLHLKDCSNLFELPDNIMVLQQLQELRLDGSSVKSLPESIKHLQELEILSLENCRELLCLPELPPLIKQLYAVNCISLELVSNLKTFATKMMGKTKHFSFKNSLKLDGHQRECIMESLHLTMVSAAFHNVSVRRLRVDVHSYNYNSVEVCLPGSSVPRQFIHRTTKSSITIELPPRSNLLGFIYSVVLSPSTGVKNNGAEIKCQCRFAEGTKTSWQNKDTTELELDHVYVWYDPFHCDNILRFYEPKVCFEFSVTTGAGEVDGSIGIKECGVLLISDPELHTVLPELDLDSGKKKHLEKGLELESGRSTTLTSIEKKKKKKKKRKRNQIRNQPGDLSEHCSSDWILDTESKSVVVEPESTEEGTGRKDHFSDVEESMESARKQTKTSAGRGRGENTIESTKAVKSKGNEGMPTESDTGLHLPADSVDEENVSKDKSSENDSDRLEHIEQAKHSDENQNLQGRQIIVHSDIHDLTVEEPYQEKENEPMGLDKPKGQDESDEDSLAKLESILSGSQKPSPKAACSTSDVAIREALHNLECLLEKSLENIFSDVELQQQLQISLKCIEQASDKKVSPSVAKLVESMTSSFEEMFKEFASNKKVVEDHTSRLQQRDKFLQQTKDAKKLQQSLKEKMSQYKFEAESLGKEAEGLDEKIRHLVEQQKTVEMKQTKLKEALEICEGENKKLKDEAKSQIPDSEELMLAIKNSESSYAAALSKQEKLNDKWEGFRTAFADNSKTLS